MLKSKVEHISRGNDSRLIKDYLSKEEKLEEFIADFPSLEGVITAAENRTFSSNQRKVLFDAVVEQYKQAGMELPFHWSEILSEKTFTITTGHQLNLFGGPKYFIYKIISVLKLTKELNKFQEEKKFIPVFWMASEDHDFEEVNSVNIFGEKISSKNKGKGPVGRLKSESFRDSFSDLNRVLGTSENAKELKTLFESSFDQKNWANFTRNWVHQFFEGKVIIVDGDDQLLKEQFTSVAIREMQEQVTEKVVSRTNESFEKLGYHTQVNHRKINLFYIENGLRERIDVLNDEIRIHQLSKVLTVNDVRVHPDCISPNALLRPVYQEKILPNVAYIGGPGELAYWFQLKGLFQELTVDFPLLVLRDSFLFVDQKDFELLDKLGLDLCDLEMSESELIKAYIERNELKNINFVEEQLKLDEIVISLKEKASNMHRDYKSMIEAESARIHKFINKLELRALRDAKFKEEVNIRKIMALRKKYFPDGVMIERKSSFMEEFLLLGKESYFTQLMERSDVFDHRIKIITVNK